MYSSKHYRFSLVFDCELSFYLNLQCASIHGIQTIDISGAESQPLSHEILSLRSKCYNCCLSIVGESLRAIVQNAAIVVCLIEITYTIIVIFVEIMLLALGDIFLDYLHIFITIRRALLMMKAQGVQQLVLYGTESKATHIKLSYL